MPRRMLLLLLAAPALPALEQLNLLLPNDRSLPMGELGSVEASAVVARTTGVSAVWYNPAGLAGMERDEVMASASIYQFSSIRVDSPLGSDERRGFSVLPGAAGLSQPLPEAFGGDGQWGVGFLVATPVFWSTSVSQQETSFSPTKGRIDIATTYDATYEVYLPTLSLGKAYGPHKVGFSGSAVVHQLTVSNSASLSYLGTGDLAAITSQYHGQTILLRLGAGWQWEQDGWALGATAAAPGIRVWQSGDRIDNQQASSLTTGKMVVSRGSTNSYDLDLDSPMQVTWAMARTTPTWSVELDLTASPGSGSRDVFPGYALESTSVNAGVITTGSQQIAALTSSRRSVLNGAIGVACKVGDGWWAHAGLLSDKTSVQDSQLFSRVDLWTAVVGLSVQGEHSLMTAGLAGTWNSSGTSTATNIADDQTVESDLIIRTWRMIIGTSYRF
jgi:hypothetical protein